VLKVEDKGPYVSGADLGDIRRQALTVEEPLQVADAVGHGLYGLLTLALGLGAEAVACDEA